MTIKQLEQQLGIPRATIRFYEKEGLITPKRNDNSYREYDEKDIMILKKVIILRKIGLSVSDINKIFNGECSLQSLLKKNVSELKNQMKELEGAISLCKIMQEREEDIFSLDENRYLVEIVKLEKSGYRFREILNDVAEFEKGVILNEFGLADSEGKPLFGLKKSIAAAVGMCICCGLLCYLADGQGRTLKAFFEGLLMPFELIVFFSIIGLPVFFTAKKNIKRAEKMKKIEIAVGVVIVIVMFVIIIFAGI